MIKRSTKSVRFFLFPFFRLWCPLKFENKHHLPQSGCWQIFGTLLSFRNSNKRNIIICVEFAGYPFAPFVHPWLLRWWTFNLNIFSGVRSDPGNAWILNYWCFFFLFRSLRILSLLLSASYFCNHRDAIYLSLFLISNFPSPRFYALLFLMISPHDSRIFQRLSAVKPQSSVFGFIAWLLSLFFLIIFYRPANFLPQNNDVKIFAFIYDALTE